MLYLEDYLEMIEHLPQELRDRFTEMRELDLSVQNDTDSIDKQIKIFFSQCRRGEIVSNQADQTFESIRKDYCKVVEDSDEKVQLASQMYDLVERYLKKLDTELLKFKCELEADHHGITDVLEKRSLELDGSSSIPSQKENRYFGSISQNQNRSLSERYRVKPEKRRDSSSTVSTPTTEKRHTLTASLSTPTARPSTPNIPHQVLQTTPTVSYTGNATIIAAAAAQAIEKTQQMQQGRRTASLKASYEAIHGSGGGSSIPHELLIGRDLGTGTHALQSMDRDVSFAVTAATTPGASSSSSSNNQKRHKKKMTTSSMSQPPSHPPHPSSSSASANANALLHQLQQTHSNDSDEMPSVYINDSGMVVEQTPEGEWVYDPNEPRYCICNQVSYGEMVACDNEDCPLEWFHYPCVGITSSPKGKWYCPDCTRARGLKKTKKL